MSLVLVVPPSGLLVEPYIFTSEFSLLPLFSRAITQRTSLVSFCFCFAYFCFRSPIQGNIIIL